MADKLHGTAATNAAKTSCGHCGREMIGKPGRRRCPYGCASKRYHARQKYLRECNVLLPDFTKLKRGEW